MSEYILNLKKQYELDSFINFYNKNTINVLLFVIYVCKISINRVISYLRCFGNAKSASMGIH